MPFVSHIIVAIYGNVSILPIPPRELVADEKLHGYLFQNAYVVDARPPEFLTEEQKETGKHDVEVMLTPWLIFSQERKRKLFTSMGQ